MPSLLPQFTTILLLIHMGLGCCFHHAHACESGICEIEAARHGSCDEHVHAPVTSVLSNDCLESQLGLGHEDHHSHDCSGEDCTFVAVRIRLASGIEEAGDASTLTVASHRLAAVATREALLACGSTAEPAPTSLRRILPTLQVWLL